MRCFAERFLVLYTRNGTRYSQTCLQRTTLLYWAENTIKYGRQI